MTVLLTRTSFQDSSDYCEDWLTAGNKAALYAGSNKYPPLKNKQHVEE